jgi:hypothetical protein
MRTSQSASSPSHSFSLRRRKEPWSRGGEPESRGSSRPRFRSGKKHGGLMPSGMRRLKQLEEGKCQAGLLVFWLGDQLGDFEIVLVDLPVALDRGENRVRGNRVLARRSPIAMTSRQATASDHGRSLAPGTRPRCPIGRRAERPRPARPGRRSSWLVFWSIGWR